LLPVVVAFSAAISFNDPAFATTWYRLDKAVQDNPASGRGFTWGPTVVGSEGISSEIFDGSPRKVQYFDKARMEINPAVSSTDLFYVTTGLLVKELVSGLRQDGVNTFTQVTPSQLQVAGDPNDNGANSIAPTYASFGKVVTLVGNQNGKTLATGLTITAHLDKSGEVSNITPPETRILQGYDEVTQHNIADVFVTFANQSGQLWDGTSFAQGQLFYGNATYVLGRPISEPYWTQATVGGVEEDVLVQLFERRVLTYTPTNLAGFKVEMGNVGQHYYRWRYLAPPIPTVTPTPLPAATTLRANPAQVYGGQSIQITGGGFTPNETLKIWETAPDTTTTGLIDIKSDSRGDIDYTYHSHGPLAGVWSITAHGMVSGVEKVATFALTDYSPAGQEATLKLSRTHGTINDSIDLHGSNFNPDEPYTFWVTAPDGKVYAGEQDSDDRNVSNHGEVNLTYTLPAAKPGQWAFTVYGLFSKRQAIAYFTYDSP